MSNNTSYSVIISYGWIDNYQQDIIWYDFDTLEDCKNFYRYLKSYTKCDNVEYINCYKFIFNVNKLIELDFDNELAVA